MKAVGGDGSRLLRFQLARGLAGQETAQLTSDGKFRPGLVSGDSEFTQPCTQLLE